MNFEKVQRKNRKAISPVLATVILIAITLIAAIAIAGFVFGLFGSFTSSAQISVGVVSCTASTSVCNLAFTNTGTANAVVNSITITVAGVQHTVGSLAITVNGGQSNVGSGAINFATGGVPPLPVGTATAGSQVTGSASASNGASIPFSGTWA